MRARAAHTATAAALLAIADGEGGDVAIAPIGGSLPSGCGAISGSDDPACAAASREALRTFYSEHAPERTDQLDSFLDRCAAPLAGVRLALAFESHARAKKFVYARPLHIQPPK